MASSTPRHHADGEHAVEPLGAEIGLGGGGQAGHDRLSRRIGAELAAEGAEVGDDLRQQAWRDGGVDQQRLGGAADIGAAHLGIRHDPPRHGRVGGGVDVGVAQPLGMGEDRHSGLGLHPASPGPYRRAE